MADVAIGSGLATAETRRSAAGRPLKPLIVASWAVIVGMAAAGELLLPGDGWRGWGPALLRAGSFGLTASLVLLFVWRYTRRALAGLAASRAGTLALQKVLGEVKRAEEETKRLAYHDAVTGLPNRLLFADRLSVALNQARRQGSQVAVLFLDLDRFKVLNDSLGHAFGDRVLQHVAQQLLSSVRAGDTVARFGGDEFTLLLPQVEGAPGAARVAEKILESLREPLRFDGREFWVTPSIGIGLFPDDADTPETLLRQADLAMYRAKQGGRNTYQPAMGGLEDSRPDRPSLERDFRSALSNGELSLHFQPILDAGSGSLRAFEALPRWRHPRLGLIEPAEFIPLAEVSGLIHPLGAWVLRTACTQVARWQRAGHHQLGLSVNVSGRQFQDQDLAAQVARALRESRLAPRHLTLEIAEADVMRHVESGIDTLRRLKGLGIGIALDAFGVGPSSLRYLKRLPVDTLKIDPSFLRELENDSEATAILHAVINLARSLKLTVVAEGVETEEQKRLLQAQGCDRMQGRLLGAPMPPAELETLLAESLPHTGRLVRSAARILGWPAR